MKVLLLASIASAHIIKWANGLNDSKCEVMVVGLNNNFDRSQYSNKIVLKNIPLPERISNSNFGSLNKLLYLIALPKIKKIIKEFNPDLLHAHYASSYGMLGSLTGFHPFILSVWGGDIFTFPQKSFLNKKLIEFSLKKADKILSTSYFMGEEIKKYTQKEISVTPFGINTDQFKPQEVNSLFDKYDIVIGTVKALEPPYGIEFLIRAFEIVAKNNPSLPLKLLIVGGGSLEIQLKQLTKDLNIDTRTIFTGFVKYTEVQYYHNMINIYLALSIIDDESFGVAILEAGATEIPVIVSDIGGLTEVVDDKVTGIVVPPKSPEKAAEAIDYLIHNKQDRIKMGKAARERILRKYDFKKNLEQMLEIYNQV